MAGEILVGAAASLTDVFERLGKGFTAETGARVRFTFAASGILKAQVLSIAPIDVFASAGEKEIDELRTAKRLEDATSIDFASNRLVLIAPRSSRVVIKDWPDLTKPDIRRIAIADPETVPAGRYAKQTLTTRRLWKTLEKRLVRGQSVRQVLSYVANSDTDAGIVFATDARLENKRVRIVCAATVKDHDPIRYLASVVKDSRNAETARQFVRFLTGKTAQRLLTDFGFAPPLQR